MRTRTLILTSTALLAAALPLLADVREGLVAYWPLDTVQGAFPMSTPDVVAGNDLSGPDMDAAVAGVPGRFGKAVAFDGATGYLTFQAPPDSDTGLPVSRRGSWTLALWVNGAGQAAGNYYFVESSSRNSTPLTAFTARANTNTTAVYFRDASGNNPVNFPAVASPSLDGTWHHVAMSYDAAGRAFRHFVDGSLVYSNTFAPNTANSAVYDLVSLGARNRNGAVDLHFAGAVDDVAVWARSLAAGEIQEVMANGIAVPVPSFPPVVSQQPAGSTNLLEGDSVTLTTQAYGTRPLRYQWQKDGADLAGETAGTLVLADLDAGDNGDYRLVVANGSGSVTSTVAAIRVNAFGSPNLTNGLVAYWPLDSVVGVKTPDLVSAYDMTVNNMGATNVIPGRWGNALYFDKTYSQYARRIHNPGDALPAYPRSNFSVAFWAKAPPAAGGWAFAEASTLGNNPAFCLGMLNSSPALDGFVRSDAGQPAGDHRLSSGVFWDDTWHHVVWVQHDAGGTPKASLYIDGVLDPAGNLNPVYPVTPNNTALASFARATPGQFFTGAIDDVAIWERPLSPAEIALLQNGPIPDPPSRLSPLVVNAFQSDLPAVAKGDSTVLRWDVPANATQVLIEPLGDVTALTSSGLGATNVTLTGATAFVLTVKRGAESVRATNTVAVVDGVAENWTLLDNFDTYSPGLLGPGGWWVDMYGNSVGVVADTDGNRRVKTLLATSGAYLRLRQLAIGTNQSRTLFFRMIPQGNPGSALRHVVGITDKSAQFYYQLDANTGPVVQPTVNDPLQNPGDWLLAARNGPGSPRVFDTTVLQPGAVYSVWIDVTNVPLDDRGPEDADLFSVHLQKEGDPQRTTVFQDYLSDRDLAVDDPLTGGLPVDDLSRVYLGGNSEPDSALFDDFYLSKSGHNATVPRPPGYTAGELPPIAIRTAGAGWEVVWSQGTLQEATSITGPWTDIPGATPPSYGFGAGSGSRFFRTRN
jgi:hypothetical protein